MHDLLDVFTTVLRDYPHGFFAALAVAVAAPPIGGLVVLRNMPVLGIAIPEMAACGVCFAYLAASWLPAALLFPTGEEAHSAFGGAEPPSWLLMAGAASVVLVGLAALSVAGRRGRNTGIHAAIAWLLAMGLSEVFLLESDYHQFTEDWLHHGQLLTIQEGPFWRVVACSAVAALLAAFNRRRFWISAFDPDQGRLLGIASGRWLFYTLLLVGGFSAIVVREIGPDVLLTLLVVPPIVLRRVTPSLAAYAPLCSLAGVLGVAASFWLSLERDWPVGPSVVVGVLAVALALAALAGVFTRVLSGSSNRRAASNPPV